MDLTNARWRRSSYSGSNGGNCVELAAFPGMVAIRDSKDPNGPVLLAPPTTLRAALRTATSA
ncbi:DUF397 domain-containing protein [Actinomadura craniellae]|uniref:DUF397 domain-containing protein n=1 Tax=Actinomadura craniellae TaxID=2231787 RepID=A0A365H004_9ACTN|nr:DUF397 domain-containing protein [Actinomadura craniellae]RAY12419.1 DUF397 domain-containing protein [Actinomadura craniellae]